MGPIGVFIIVVFGIFVPFLTIVLFPLRAFYLLAKGNIGIRIGCLLLLLPWAYLALQIAQDGYVSVQDRPGMPGSTGPTVNPWYWFYIGLLWMVIEGFYQVHRRKQRLTRVKGA